MKQERKNKILSISLLVLIATAIAFFLFQGQTDEIDKDLFKIPQLSEVDQIDLVAPDDEIVLAYEGAAWRVNSRLADIQLVTVLFATLQQFEPKRKVSTALSDSIASVLRGKGTHILLYKEGNLIKEFYAGGNTAKTEAYFMDEDGEPYVVTIPGYGVYVSGIFELEERGWRDKRIFNFNWRNFKRLQTQFLQQPDQNFTIEDLGNGFDLVNAPPSDTTKLNDYLDHVSLLVASQFMKPGSNPRYDSLLTTQPAVTILVFDLGDNVRKLELYKPLDNDPDVVGRMGENEAVIFTREQVQPVLKSKDFFKAE